MITTYLYVLVLVFASFSKLEAEIIFTSPLKTRTLFASVDNVIETLEKYINTEENRLENLKSTLDDWEKEHHAYADNFELQLSNHLSQFNFLYKLKQRWTQLLNETKNNTASDYISQMKINMTWPSDVDIVGIMDSIINLQNIHNMKADTFARGELNGVITNTSLDYEECLMMTKRCFETIHYKFALQWALVTLEKYSSEGIENEQQLSDILYYISYTSHMTGDDDLAFKSITTYMEKNSHDRKAKALQNSIYLKHPEKLGKNAKRKIEISQQIKNLCKQLTTREELSRANHMRCQYRRGGSDFLKIAPLKEEFLSYRPLLSIFRDVLYDSEIDFLKDNAMNRLQDITTLESSSWNQNAVKMAYLEDDADDHLRKISRRVQDMVSMHTNSKLGYRLYKFTAGGSYIEEGENNENGNEDFTKTVMFHMNDVIQGGSTVFPRSNITVKAAKGDAVLWQDIFDSGSNDLPKYSSCSVLAGQKWTLMTQIGV